MRRHRPAMLREVLALLAIKPGATVVDATVGHGGHAVAMMQETGEKGRLIGFDWDVEMLRAAEENLKRAPGEKQFIHSDFRMLPSWMAGNYPEGADAILMDFGVNLQHFDDPERGFSFSKDAPLDMRMDRKSKETAAAWINRASENELTRALREYGGEKWAGPIARQIVKRRKEHSLKRTFDLVDAVLAAIPKAKRDRRIHPATRTFQGVRIAINKELENLEETVEAIALQLRPGGRMAALSYHSGEDRAVKVAFKRLSENDEYLSITKRPVRPSLAEVEENPRSRSARLRAIAKRDKEKR